MSEVEVDYATVLADLKARRDKLDAAIAGIEAVMGLRASETNGVAGTTARSEAETLPCRPDAPQARRPHARPSVLG